MRFSGETFADRSPTTVMGETTGAVEVTVRPARPGDDGRDVVRLPASVQSRLGIVTGDPVTIGGEAVAMVWPDEENGDVARIDADTRRRAGVTVGDTVRLTRADVDPASAVTLETRDGTRLDRHDAQERLADRVVRSGTRIRLDDGEFDVIETRPGGPVRITDETELTVAEPPGSAGDGPPDVSVRESTYEDIGGLESELDSVREMIELPLSGPERFDRLGIDPPTGVLLFGPPGTGKTLIARAVATEIDASFHAISGPEIVSKYKGESEQRLREAFEGAAAAAPAIVFLDEIDAIAGKRDADADMENRVVAQLLTLMDGLVPTERVVVIGATNRLDAVDPALRRAGRFDRELEIGVPDAAGRREVLAVHTRSAPLADDVDLNDLAARTHGFVGADLAALVREAGIAALTANREPLELRGEDFEEALSAVEPSAMREYVAERPSVTFAEVGGLDEAKRRLREAVEWPLEYGPLFDAAGTDPPTGLLLSGPSGTGKTLLARAVAGETGVNFLRVDGPDLLDRYVGESEAPVREVFERARRTAPTIVFLDELDAVAGRRGESEVTERAVSQLRSALDRAADHPNIVVLAATSRQAALDDALRRPGRLDTALGISIPDQAARREILEIHTADTPLANDVDLARLAAETDGDTGAELESLVRRATMAAIRETAEGIDPEAAESAAASLSVTAAHFDGALDGTD
jgi:transitional endoplasmic reticulum ATPase